MIQEFNFELLDASQIVGIVGIVLELLKLLPSSACWIMMVTKEMELPNLLPLLRLTLRHIVRDRIHCKRNRNRWRSAGEFKQRFIKFHKARGHLKMSLRCFKRRFLKDDWKGRERRCNVASTRYEDQYNHLAHPSNPIQSDLIWSNPIHCFFFLSLVNSFFLFHRFVFIVSGIGSLMWSDCFQFQTDLDWFGLNWFALDCDSTEIIFPFGQAVDYAWIGFKFALNWTELNWTELDWTCLGLGLD